MSKIVSWIEKNWNDPVWSKVFAAIILSVLGAIGLFLLALLKEIPFEQLISSTFDYLKNTFIEINYLTICVVLFLISVLTIPIVRLKIISFQLSHLKIPKQLKINSIDLEEFLNGYWRCTYSRGEEKGGEMVKITNGNKYRIDGKIYFVLTDMNVNFSKKHLEWTKTTYPNNSKHSREILSIKNNNELIGSDDIGWSINYTRITSIPLI